MRPHQLLALVAVSLAVCDAQQQLPTFKAPGDTPILQAAHRTWNAGQPSTIMFLSKIQKSTLEVQLEGGSCTHENQVLKYKCPGSSDEQSLSITGLSDTKKLCTKSNVPVQLINNIIPNQLSLQPMSLSSTAAYSQVFTKLLEMKVEVTCKEGTLTSKSLFLSDMRALESVKTNTIVKYGIIYQERLLTEAGVRFLATMDVNDDVYGSVDLVDPPIIELIKTAPDLIKSKITMGASIVMGPESCGGAVPSSMITFSTYNRRMNVDLMKSIYLNTADGKLHYSTHAISKVASDMAEKGFAGGETAEIRFCVAIGVDSSKTIEMQDMELTQTLTMRKDSNPYKQKGKPSSNCKVIDNAPRTLTLFSGADTTYITCPIVCSMNEDFKFEKSSPKVHISPDADLDWRKYPPLGVSIHKTGKVLQFPSRVSAIHSGQYSCHGGSASFTFTVSVVSVPHFQTPLPDRIFAMEGSGFNFSCVSAFTNINSVTVTPQFHTNQVNLSTPKWQQLTLDEYNKLVAPAGVSAVSVHYSSEINSKSLTVSVSSVPAATPQGKNFTHRLVCKASVSAADASKLGMPSYSMQTSSDVLFVPRPKMRDFSVSTVDCSDAERCKAEKGERFAVSLQPELSSYLNAIGVEVDADFRVGNNRLQEVLRDFVGPVSSSQCNISFNSTSHSLVFTVNPVNNEYLLKKLSNVTVTPVFNFKYSRDWNLRNLKFSVDSEKSKLMADRKCSFGNRCFYSTDFDIAANLSNLQLFVNFKDTAVPIDAANKKPQSAAASLGFSRMPVAAAVLLLLLLQVTG